MLNIKQSQRQNTPRITTSGLILDAVRRDGPSIQHILQVFGCDIPLEIMLAAVRSNSIPPEVSLSLDAAGISNEIN